jgi:ABC-type transport system substrate-binding protein/DNA-binding SARP family transcriptional activator/DNA-binding beta-propeller fold protein YncE
LAILILNAGRAVPTTQLIDDLWGPHPPATADHTVEAYISRIRRLLRAEASEDLLLTQPPGYLLRVDPDRVDAVQFQRRVADGEATLDRGDAALAAQLIGSALALWRGAPLADVGEPPFAAAAAQRLEDLRLAALEKRIEAELQMGRHRELVPELEALTGAHPFRETFHGQLMLALYQSGRQADALAVYRRTRTQLMEELGIDPGQQLQRLEQAILRQDPMLDDWVVSGAQVIAAADRSHADTSGAADSPAPTSSLAAHDRDSIGVATLPPSAGLESPPLPGAKGSRLGRSRYRRQFVVAALLVLAVAVTLLTPRLWQAHPERGIPANGIGLLTPDWNAVAGGFSLPDAPGSMVGGAGSLWVSSPEGHVVYRIDPATRAVTQTIPVGAGAGGIAIGGGAVWVANALVGTVSRIDISTNRVVQTIGVGSLTAGLAFGEGSVWAADPVGGAVFRIDPVTGRLIRTIPMASDPSGLAVGGGSVWVVSRSDNSVTRIDPITGQPGDRIAVGGGPSAIEFGHGSIWVANGLDSTVSRIDPDRGVLIDTIPVGNGPEAVAVDSRGVWVASALAGTLSRIDSGRGEVASVLSLGNRPGAVSIADDRVWVAVRAAASHRHRGGTLRVLSSRDFGSIDPAEAYPAALPQYLVFAYDTLVTFQRVGGSSGLQVVPDLAVAVPTPAAGGTSYTFTLRPDLRYSNGEPIRPADFRHGLERVFALNTSAASFFTGLVGADQCVAGSSCDLSKGITVDDHARTVRFRLSAPDPDFLYKLAFFFTAPVPPDVPAAAIGTRPIPSTGPYMIGRYLPGHEVELVRNPQFQEWSAAAQPDGVPDRIVWTFGKAADEATAAVERGQADWMADPPADFAQISARFSRQVHVNPLFGLGLLAFNVREPPFDDLRVRQAVSFAADRAKVVSLLGGRDTGGPTCQILPPGIPGYRPYCPFTTNPSRTGAWTGPDVARARRLVARSHTQGMKVAVWSHRASPDAAIGAYVVSLLRKLGYAATLRLASEAEFARNVNDSRRRVQASVGAWIADYPSASDFLGLFFKCSASRLADPDHTRSGSFFCDPGIDREIDAASGFQISDPQKASRLWATVDRKVTRLAPWVPLVSFQVVDFVSARVGNYQFHPLWGILLDQLWVQ